MDLFQLTELMLNKQRALNTKDICSTCGHVYMVESMTDLTRVGYDPCMVYECAECTTNGKVSA